MLMLAVADLSIKWMGFKYILDTHLQLRGHYRIPWGNVNINTYHVLWSSIVVLQSFILQKMPKQGTYRFGLIWFIMIYLGHWAWLGIQGATRCVFAVLYLSLFDEKLALLVPVSVHQICHGVTVILSVRKNCAFLKWGPPSHHSFQYY